MMMMMMMMKVLLDDGQVFHPAKDLLAFKVEIKNLNFFSRHSTMILSKLVEL